ncbi:hypothetical protein [Flammeovirga sp. SJP92]|uniref:hypothetical protein n=1 Tax=Flammeovirga sp. SJP92 TaxID=1775430 RepID=UPI00078696B7|nr:hypothetical protein [Flammeovirga sp. SJP92]KXX71247.1 hypothetical protein AVL50_09325 [Flammeovirga sp. SJP92]
MEINNRLLMLLSCLGVLTAINAFKEIQQSTELVSHKAQKIADIYQYGFPIVLMYYTQKSKTKQKENSNPLLFKKASFSSPIEKVKSLTLEEFLTELSFLMQKKPYAQNKKLLQQMKAIGIHIGKPFSMHDIGPVEREYYRLIPSDVQLELEKHHYYPSGMITNRKLK